MKPLWKLLIGGTSFTIPVTITVLDVWGYVAKVEGASMQPSLNPREEKGFDYVFLNRWRARSFQFQRGEIVSLSAPNNPDQKIIKRIIGLEGDTVRTLSYKNRYVRVPDGHCWIEGDHHGQSLDSNLFGPISIGLINAKASQIVWPPHRRQTLSIHYPKQRVNSLNSIDLDNKPQQALDKSDRATKKSAENSTKTQQALERVDIADRIIKESPKNATKTVIMLPNSKKDS